MPDTGAYGPSVAAAWKVATPSVPGPKNFPGRQIRLFHLTVDWRGNSAVPGQEASAAFAPGPSSFRSARLPRFPRPKAWSASRAASVRKRPASFQRDGSSLSSASRPRNRSPPMIRYFRALSAPFGRPPAYATPGARPGGVAGLGVTGCRLPGGAFRFGGRRASCTASGIGCGVWLMENA